MPGVVRCQVSISEHLTEVGPVRLLHLLAFGLRGSLLPPHLVPNAMVALAVLAVPAETQHTSPSRFEDLVENAPAGRWVTGHCLRLIEELVVVIQLRQLHRRKPALRQVLQLGCP